MAALGLVSGDDSACERMRVRSGGPNAFVGVGDGALESPSGLIDRRTTSVV